MKNFVADYSHGRNGSLSRTRIQGNIVQLNGAQSDFAVQSYLQNKHPGSEIMIYNISWR